MVALLLALLHVAPGISLEGVVRSGDSGSPIVAAEVVVTPVGLPNAERRTRSDSLGRYVVPDLPAGTYDVRVSRDGYDARELDVFLAGGPRMVLDIALAARPIVLSTVYVRAPGDDAFPTPNEADSPLVRDAGTRSIRGDQLHADPALAEPDALLPLTTAGDVSARPEGPTALHVFGGAAAENAVLLDGVPLFNPYHTAGTLTAIDPDIVSSVTLHAGAPGAEFGDATSAVIGVSVADGDSARLTSRGGLTTDAVRQAVGGPLPDRLGTFLVSGRMDRSPIITDRRGSAQHAAHFGDLFAKTTTGVAGGSLELFAFHSADRLAFAATDDGEGDAILAPATFAAGPNALGWSTGTDAARWRASHGSTAWDVRAWHTRFDADIDWAQRSRLVSSLEDLGAAATGTWTRGSASLSAGLDAQRYDVRYRVSRQPAAPSAIAAGPDSLASPLSIAGAPLLASAFVETRLRAGTRWSTALGIREQLAAGAFRAPEPRVSVDFAPSPRIAFSVGVARLHQDVQSLRNEESPLDAVTGILLPAIAGSVDATGTHRVPVAVADQAVAAMDLHLDARTTLDLTAFARAETGVALVAPVTMQPFATDGFIVGTVRASGMSLAVSHDGRTVSADIGYSYQRIRDRANASSYVPSYGAAQSLTLGIGVRVLPTTTVRLAAVGSSGGATSLLAGHMDWSPFSAYRGSANFEGSPHQIVGPLDGSRLPTYLRLDLGVTHTVDMHLFGWSAVVTGNASLTNLLNRANAFGLSVDRRTDALHTLYFPSRTAVLGLDWTF